MTKSIDRYFDIHEAQADLGLASVHSGLILLFARSLNVIVQLGSTVVIARLLGPHDFGLATIVLALTGFAFMLIDLGTTDAAVHKARVTHLEISTLFWINISVGAVLTVLFAAASGILASVFGERELVNIALVSSLTFVMTGLAVQHYALMRRAMEFRRLAIIDICANIIGSVVAIVLALRGWGYWALILKPLMTLGLTAIGAWISCPWLPGRPSLTPEVKGLLRFGLGVCGFTLSDQLVRSADRLAIGYFYGSGPLGFFQNAFLLYSNLINLLAESLHNVAVSSLSRLRDQHDELKRSWALALSTLSFVVVPGFATLAVIGTDFVVLLLGEKWAPAGPLLCVFAMRGIGQTVERSMGWLHISAGRPERWMRWGVASAGVQLVALAIGLPFGPMGVAIAYAVAMFGLCIPAVVYAGRPLGISTRDVLAAVGPQIISAVATAGIGSIVHATLLSGLSHGARFLITIPICAAIYLLLVVGVFGVRQPLRLAHRLLRDLMHRTTGGSSPFPGGTDMSPIEQKLTKLDDWPMSAIWRVAFGFCVTPILGLLPVARESMWVYAALFIMVLMALRVVPAVLRRGLSVSTEANEIWKRRRFMSKDYDSYQWQKLFWIGLGMLPYAIIGGLSRGGLLVAAVCLLGGGAGLMTWQKAKPAGT